MRVRNKAIFFLFTNSWILSFLTVLFLCLWLNVEVWILLILSLSGSSVSALVTVLIFFRLFLIPTETNHEGPKVAPVRPVVQEPRRLPIEEKSQVANEKSILVVMPQPTPLAEDGDEQEVLFEERI